MRPEYPGIHRSSSGSNSDRCSRRSRLTAQSRDQHFAAGYPQQLSPGEVATGRGTFFVVLPFASFFGGPSGPGPAPRSCAEGPGRAVVRDGYRRQGPVTAKVVPGV